MKAKPLNLEEMADEIIRVIYPTYDQISVIPLRNAIIRKKERMRLVLEQHIESASNFYLRYKDNPKLLIEEHPQLKGEFRKKFGRLIIGVINWMSKFDNCRVSLAVLKWKRDYNEWLFRTAFKRVIK